MRQSPSTLLLLPLLLMTPAGCCGPEVEGLGEAEGFYASRPPEEQPKAGWQEVPEGLPDMRAETCGGCHEAIYEEWSVSTHGLAWVDRQFQAEIKKSGNRWLCNNCHTPLLNQMERWAVDLEGGDVEEPLYVDNPDYDPAFRDEGITCAACHVRGGVVEGPTGVETPAHPTRKAERFLDETICLDCHQAMRTYPGKSFICVFNTGREWEEGPYGASGVPCQSCHMEEVERPQATGQPPRVGRRHFWPGAGIYKVEGKGPPLDQLYPGMAVSAEPSAGALALTLTNRAGHMLPTGDPERFVTVAARFYDGAGEAVGEETVRIGQRWKWWPEPEKLGDNRLAPAESREVVVPRPDGAVRWEVTVTNHRINEEAMSYHALEGYPASRVRQELQGEFPQE